MSKNQQMSAPNRSGQVAEYSQEKGGGMHWSRATQMSIPTQATTYFGEKFFGKKFAPSEEYSCQMCHCGTEEAVAEEEEKMQQRSEPDSES